MQRRSLGYAAAALAASVATRGRAARADAAAPYPVRPLRMVVAFPPGGGTDIGARVISERLGAALGQTVVIENRAGAGGNIGMGVAARAANDGYNLLFASSTFVINPALYPTVPYDPLKDFVPVSYVANTPAILVAHPSIPVRTLPEVVAYVRANPGTFYASPGSGTSQHLAGEMLRLEKGIDLVHVPFSGGGPSTNAALAGQVPLLFAALPAVQPHIASGGLRAIAVTTIQRSSFAPDVPTFDESGVPGFDVDQLAGVLAPAGTPAAVIQRLGTELQRIARSPEGTERLRAVGFEPVGSSPEAFAEQIAAQLPKWRAVIQRAGIRAD